MTAPATVIDIYSHIAPEPYLNAIARHASSDDGVVKLTANLASSANLDRRLGQMDRYGISEQALVLPSPGVEAVVSDRATAAELAKIANEGIAEIVAAHPDRFIGVANVAMNDPEGMGDEVRRCVTELGHRGVLLYSSAAGSPIDGAEFEAFYDAVEELNVPIWLHPARSPDFPEYVGETRSKYLIWQVFGWPYETTAAMARLVFSGVLQRHPNLKVITHHHGAMLPAFGSRIEPIHALHESLGNQAAGDALDRPALEYFKRFYTDTASMGSTPPLMAAYEFFGPSHVLFGTDAPFDMDGGEFLTRETLAAVERMDISAEEREMITRGNARRLLGRERSWS